MIPINFSLKSKLEKDAILNSYKLFLKSCDFNIQILIQSKKESLSKMFLILKENSKNENKKIKELCSKYEEYIRLKNDVNKAASKAFYIIIKQDTKDSQKEEEKELNKKIAITAINENFFKVKEALSRCGNIVYDVNKKDELVYILSSFFATDKSKEGE